MLCVVCMCAYVCVYDAILYLRLHPITEAANRVTIVVPVVVVTMVMLVVIPAIVAVAALLCCKWPWRKKTTALVAQDQGM